MSAKPQTVDDYLSSLPAERREVLQAVRQAILQNLPQGYEEGIQYGMIGYYVPHHIYPAGYHADPRQPVPFAGLASQKNHMAIYLMSVYADPELECWFREAWIHAGKKLDMGKSCVRFKKLDAVPLDVIAETVRRVPVSDFIDQYESSRVSTKTSKTKTSKTNASTTNASTTPSPGARKTVRQRSGATGVKRKKVSRKTSGRS
jgi:uncharacterized protein YdhG (YjbR/CyaY superfamily)